jgi:multiple sugar transport system substrate-binding protein
MQPDNEKLLDPENPITVSVWNYYNGSVKDKFDSLVTEFNDTVGADMGIVVEAQSYGDVNELADAVFDSANKEMGAMPMPDVFAAYPDNAFRINKVSELVNLKEYFSEDELGEIRQEFLTEGMFDSQQTLKILPIAKSTENLYINKTYWDEFSADTGASLEDLNTWEGLVKTAKKYYEYSGKAFFGIDGNANYMLVSAMQLGEELFVVEGDRVTLNFSQETAFKIWVNYYIPYINGYFAKTGRFSSDDARTGLVAAYVGSTAGASYFPSEVATGDGYVAVDVMTLPYPYFDGSKAYAVQQGAGMCISKSDETHEYAASLFLKWFIDFPQNTDFAVATAYLPVKSEALNADSILAEMDSENIYNTAVKKSIVNTIDMFKTHSLYGNKPFDGSYDVRSIIETHLLNRVKSDLDILNQRVENGENRLDVIKELSSREQFYNWYQEFTAEIQSAL